MRYSDKIFTPATTLTVILFVALLLPFQQLSAQAKRAGGASPAASKGAVNKSAANRPAANSSSVNKASVNKPNTTKSSVNKPDLKAGGGDQRAGINNSGNTTNNIKGGNKVNIDNSKKNVNVNVDNSKDIHVNNSRNTVVRRNSMPYARPPYVYGGYRYRCYHPYYFHPYRPFVWGPMWHPWGFFIATLATTAILISIVDNDVPTHYDMASNYISGFGFDAIEKQLLFSGPAFMPKNNMPEYVLSRSENARLAIAGEYYYDQGVYYLKGDGGYTVVSAPLGAKIKTLPTGYETVSVDDKGTKNYYYGGVFYEKRSDGYVVVAPMAGTVVEHISEGGEEVKMGDITYVKFGETYFQPIQENGKDMYEVADVEEDK
ncbi:MAG TPA: DUF6515 family protein [Chitinophagaceae bacterium]|nr:DUF6515 family protein [Chitinophagaceae bacterium]